jgi:hypothetical protein
MSSPRKLIHSRGTSYEITCRINDRMVRRRFPTRAAALDAMAQARTQIRAGTHLAPAEARITLAAYATQWVIGLQVADSTSRHYQLSLRNHILPALGHGRLGRCADPTSSRSSPPSRRKASPRAPSSRRTPCWRWCCAPQPTTG